MTTWLHHVQSWKDCQRCPLGQQRDKICLARSDWPAGTARPNLRLPCDVVFVGEAPGMSEDTAGLPFVGPAGEHPTCGLNYIIDNGLLSHHTGITYAITNLVACFPRLAKQEGDHKPEHGEVLACRPRLIEFINIAQPRLIVRVGDWAVRYMGFDKSVSMVDIVHPAHILRMPLAQRQMAVQHCIVNIRSAVESVLQSPRQPWKQWGKDHAEDQSSDYWTDDSIPF